MGMGAMGGHGHRPAWVVMADMGLMAWVTVVWDTAAFYPGFYGLGYGYGSRGTVWPGLSAAWVTGIWPVTAAMAGWVMVGYGG